MIHAASQSTANGNMTTRNGSGIGYTSYNLPNLIMSGSNSSTLSYGAHRNRYKQVSVASGVTETTIYVGGLLEKVTRGSVTEYRHLIHGGKGVAAIYTRPTSGAATTYYVHVDHLGSPELITDSAGAQVVKLSFGAYGERRGSNWSGTPSGSDWTAIGNTTRDGFTGHEHLDAVSLIHMNGRVYDPVVGRFLSADPVIALGSGQGPNPYAYVMNNPLRYTDPSGYVVQPNDPSPFPDADQRFGCGFLPMDCGPFGSGGFGLPGPMTWGSEGSGGTSLPGITVTGGRMWSSTGHTGPVSFSARGIALDEWETWEFLFEYNTMLSGIEITGNRWSYFESTFGYGGGASGRTRSTGRAVDPTEFLAETDRRLSYLDGALLGMAAGISRPGSANVFVGLTLAGRVAPLPSDQRAAARQLAQMLGRGAGTASSVVSGSSWFLNGWLIAENIGAGRIDQAIFRGVDFTISYGLTSLGLPGAIVAIGYSEAGGSAALWNSQVEFAIRSNQFDPRLPNYSAMPWP